MSADFKVSETARAKAQQTINSVVPNEGAPQYRYPPDTQLIADLVARKQELGDRFPRICILVIAYNVSHLLVETLARIPQELEEVVDEIVVFDNASLDDTFELGNALKDVPRWSQILNVYRNPKNLGYGGNQKVGFNYAVAKGMDIVVMLHGDGQYAPEFLPNMLGPAVFQGKEVVFGSRMMNRRDALKGGMPLYKWFGNQVLSRFENLILGMKLTEYHSGYRLYSTQVLERLPIAENTDDFHFDTQIIVQCRALGVEIFETPIPTFYGDETCNVNGLAYAKDVILSVLDYRLHQLHVVRRQRYLVDRRIEYTRKFSKYSSHEQILDLIPEGDHRILEWGAGYGLLARDLLAKGGRVLAVDTFYKLPIDDPRIEYRRMATDSDQELPLEREFDVIILADVISQFKHARALLGNLQKVLKPGGRIIVSAPNIAIWFYRLSLLVGRWNYGPRGPLDEKHLHFFTRSTFRSMIEQAGFRVTQERLTSVPFEVVFESSGRARMLKILDSLYFLLVRFYPRLFAYQFVLEAEIRSLDAAGKGEGKIVPRIDEYTSE